MIHKKRTSLPSVQMGTYISYYKHHHSPCSRAFMCDNNENGNQPVFSPFFKRKQRNTEPWTIDMVLNRLLFIKWSLREKLIETRKEEIDQEQINRSIKRRRELQEEEVRLRDGVVKLRTFVTHKNPTKEQRMADFFNVDYKTKMFLWAAANSIIDLSTKYKDQITNIKTSKWNSRTWTLDTA